MTVADDHSNCVFRGCLPQAINQLNPPSFQAFSFFLTCHSSDKKLNIIVMINMNSSSLTLKAKRGQPQNKANWFCVSTIEQKRLMTNHLHHICISKRFAACHN